MQDLAAAIVALLLMLLIACFRVPLPVPSPLCNGVHSYATSDRYAQ